MILKPEYYPQGIRSFVVRTLRMTSGQSRAIEKGWQQWGCQVSDGLFGAKNPFPQPEAPLILDIGFGMGQALIETASDNPNKNYLGVEVYPPGVGSLLIEIQSRQLTNIRVYCADVKIVLAQCLTACSLSGVQVFFPDPWHKRRHHKRRLIQPDFLEEVALRLKDNGFIHIATDWQPYAEHAAKCLNAHVNFEMLQDVSPFVRPPTKFEKRGRNLGHGIVDLVAVKAKQSLLGCVAAS